MERRSTAKGLALSLLTLVAIPWGMNPARAFGVHEVCDSEAPGQAESGAANKPEDPVIDIRWRSDLSFKNGEEIAFSGFSAGFNNQVGLEHSTKRDFEFICTAGYPIEFYYDQVENKTISEPEILHRRWPDISRPLGNPSRFVIYFHVDLNYIKAKNHTFGCRGVQDRCLQRYWNSWFDHATKNIRFHEWEAGNSSTLTATVTNLHHHVQKEDCPASFYYKANDISKSKGLRKIACRFKDGSNGIIKRRPCSSSVTDCLNLYRQRSSANSSCWQPLVAKSTSCPGCRFLTVSESLKSFVATCEQDKDNDDSDEELGPGRSGEKSDDSNGPSAGALVIIGVSMDSTQNAKFYFDLNDVEHSSMIHMDKVDRFHELGTSVTVKCRASMFYTATPLRFALQYAGSPDVIFAEDQIDYNLGGFKQEQNEFQTEYTLKLEDRHGALARVYCFAPLLRSPGWLNASRPLEIKRKSAQGAAFDVNHPHTENLKNVNIVTGTSAPTAATRLTSTTSSIRPAEATTSTPTTIRPPSLDEAISHPDSAPSRMSFDFESELGKGQIDDTLELGAQPKRSSVSNESSSSSAALQVSLCLSLIGTTMGVFLQGFGQFAHANLPTI